MTDRYIAATFWDDTDDRPDFLREVGWRVCIVDTLTDTIVEVSTEFHDTDAKAEGREGRRRAAAWNLAHKMLKGDEK